ncbi:hypothetical protein Lal_00031822 [Lupinus albus]|uniref:Uncharacterized protein n=1 Tax=Lupinus albus TaxID=3870 RepID=A0A6A5LW03_LUPAL|nr:hypothetical protein Lalb_Chr23g0273781 [Lupinus albus]KAF1864859.1 hypothetical protein Lal_00031822 [Lupinus albus]
MEVKLLRLFVIFLVISYLIYLTEAVPITRTESLIQGSHVPIAVKITNHKFISDRKWHSEEPTITERMDLELHDYPPSGANGRHTPKSPYP